MEDKYFDTVIYNVNRKGDLWKVISQSDLIMNF